MGVIYNSIPSSTITLSATVPNAVSPQASNVTGRTNVVKTMQQTVVAATVYTAYSVTAGKTLYVTNFGVASLAQGTHVRIGDNLASGSIPASGTVEDNIALDLALGQAGGVFGTGERTFNPPLKFTNSVKWSIPSAAGATQFWFSGWEE